MIGILTGLLAKAKTIGIVAGALAVASLALYAWHEHGTNERLRTEKAVALNAAAENLKAYEAAKADAARQASALEQAARQIAASRETITRLRTRVDDAPNSDDGPLAPVLRDLLAGMRDNAANSGGARGAPDSAGKPVDLRPGPGGP